MPLTEHDRRLIINAFRYRSRELRGGGVSLVVLGVLITAIAPFAFDGPNAWLLGPMLIVPGLALWLFSRRSTKAHALTEALEGPNIVWVYLHENNTGGLVQRLVRFGQSDGTFLEMPLAPGQEHFVPRLQSLLPQATHGFSQDRAAAFKNDPASLRP